MLYSNTWQTFLQTPVTQPTLKREYPEWHKGRQRFCVWGILLPQDAVAELHRSGQQWLRDYLWLPYMRQPHITLTACGFWLPEAAFDEPDNFSRSQLQAQLALLERAQLDPFDIEIGGLNSFTTAPFFEAVDHQRMLPRIRQCLPSYFETIRDKSYCPHVTVSCYQGVWPTAEVARRIDSFHPQPSLTVRVDEIALLSYSTTDIASPLKVEQRFKLGEVSGALSSC